LHNTAKQIEHRAQTAYAVDTKETHQH
jgi:hypothetical protein